jgi:3'-phosphoadenosine 5'-phosphosulfate sulfotransferase (PAPS reductase)/FAD synthetase
VIDLMDGDRVEVMVGEGLRIVREAVEQYRPAAIVAAYSGGDDSIVSTHFAVGNLPDVLVFNADTLVGLAPARRHIAQACERFGWPLEVGRAEPEGCPKRRRLKGRTIPFDPSRHLVAGVWREGATAYEESVLNHGFPGRGRPQHARMYQRLKERPIMRLLRRFGASKAKAKLLFISGIRQDESAVRAGYKRAVAEGYFGDVWANPFYWRTAADFEAYRQEFGLPRNPVKPHCGVSGECCCLTFPNDSDGRERDRYAAIDPEFGRYIDDLEAKVKEVFPWGYGESPPRWWVQRQKDKKVGQASLFDLYPDQPSAFQPMCVGCARGK